MWNLNSTDVEAILDDAYHHDGPGRPPRNPSRRIQSVHGEGSPRHTTLRELERRLWSDERLRTICDLQPEEPAYGRSALSRFPKRVGTERLQRILNETRRRLIELGVVKGDTAAMDDSFIKAHSSINMKTDSERKTEEVDC